jgi:hypothetical protein
VLTPDRTAVEALGWASTAVFVASYFFTRADTLVRVQIAGALMWVGYGLLMRAPPVVAANLLVVAAAAWKARGGVSLGSAAAGEAEPVAGEGPRRLRRRGGAA